MIARQFSSYPPLTVVSQTPVSANLLKPVRPEVEVDLSQHQVYIAGTRQPIRVLSLKRVSVFVSQGFQARCWLPNQRQYRTFPLPGNVSLYQSVPGPI